jgi:hypothetical protein
MAAPSYTTDLTSQQIFTDGGVGTWSLISSGGGGQNSLTDPETDDYVQGSSSVSRSPWSSAARGMVFNSSQTIASGDAVFIWTKADVAQALDTKAGVDPQGGGIQCLIGSASSALNAYYVDGSDTYTFGGWKCYPIDPTVAASGVFGSAPSATTSWFGVAWNVPASGPSKGFPFKIDAMRVGRSFSITGGDLANGYANFSELSSTSGSLANQWGVFNFSNGVYTMQGLMELGTTVTAVDFRDSNKGLFVANTEFVTSNFNGIEVNNAASRVDWTNISISALGSVSKGYFLANANADINLESCSFVGMSTFGFLSNSTINDTVFRACGQIDQNLAVMARCTISNSTATSALLLDNSAADLGGNVSETTFISSGTGHAIEITGGTSATLNNISFNNYAVTDGSTGNEAVYINIGSGNFTVNVSGGDTPTIRTAGATVTVEASAQVTLEGLKVNSEVRFYSGTDPDTSVEVAGVENSGSSFSFSQSVAGQVGYYVIFAIGYKDIYVPYTYKSVDDTLAIQQVIDRVYDNP